MFLQGLGNFTDNEVRGNHATGKPAPFEQKLPPTTGGGGLHVLSGEHIFSGNEVYSNKSEKDGGGIYLSHNEHPALLYNRVVFKDNLFELNDAKLNGGAIWVHASSDAVNHQGAPLLEPDLANVYTSNSPEDIYRQ